MKRSPLKIGVLIVIALAAATALAFVISGQRISLFGSGFEVRAYFKGSAGLNVGAPVNLDGVTIGNVRAIRIVTTPAITPVEVTMAINSKYRSALLSDSKANLKTIGVLGSTEVDIDNIHAHGQPIANHGVLPTGGYPNLEIAMRSFQAMNQKFNATLTQANGLIGNLDSDKGSIGKFINDPTLRNHAVKAANQFKTFAPQISSGRGTVGMLLTDDSLSNHLKDMAAKFSNIETEINSGKGTAGKFVKDPALSKNLKEASTQLHQISTEVNSGHSAIGMMTRNTDFKKRLNQATGQLSAISADVSAGRGTIGQFAKNPSLHNHLNELVKNTHQLATALRKHPRKSFVIRLRIF